MCGTYIAFSTTDIIKRKTIMYRTMNTKIKKTENALIEIIVKLLKGMIGEIASYPRARRFGTIEVRFQNEETAARRATKTIITVEWIFYPMYIQED